MNWSQELDAGFREQKQLLKYLGHDEASGSLGAQQQFSTRVPKGFADKMKRNDFNCPLLKQVLPSSAELKLIDGYVIDPLQESQFNMMPGLLHKYHGRVLITIAGSCAINCRYCFRRHFPYQDNRINLKQWQAIVDYIKNDSSINEVIFSGGDPLMVQTKRLAEYIEPLESIKHLDTLRFHSRMPIVLPERIDAEFLELMARLTLKKVMVVHCNHSEELCPKTAQALADLKKKGFVLLNQSVLLKGVNDHSKILAELSHKLFGQGVMPYYLHLLDKVKGTAHFDMTVADAKQIYKKLQIILPGYLVPKLTREIPSEKHKTLIN